MLEPANDVEHLVLYTPGGIDTFPVPPPGNNYRDENLHIEGSLSLRAEPAVALPEYDSAPFRHLIGILGRNEHERYFALQDALLGDHKTTPSRMLGYPDAIGVDPEAIAFFRRAGRPDSRYWLREELDTDEKRAHFDHVHERLDEITTGLLDWVPLFRLRSYSEIGVTFWDAGMLDVMIHRDDLASLRFDRTMAVIASS
jgi:hypothetical protein